MKFIKEGIGEIPGLFGIEHLVFALLGALVLFFMLFFSLRKKNLDVNKVIKISFWVLLILEILKIIWNLTLRSDVTYSDWIPLYFCSITIYASFMASFCKGKIKEAGYVFLFHGSIIGGIIYFACPNTCLLVHPFWHILTFHALFYHVLGIYLGLLIVIKKVYIPKIKEVWGYLIVTYSVSLCAYIINLILGSNLMMVSHDSGTWPLTTLYQTFKGFYPLVMATLQNVGTFFVSLGAYKLVIKITERKSDKERLEE